MAADGWYDLQVCVRDLNNLNPMPPTSDVFCDEETNAVLIDSAGPGAELIKPVDGAVASGDYLMVGKAWDPAWAWNDPFMQYGGVNGNLVRLLRIHQLAAGERLVRTE